MALDLACKISKRGQLVVTHAWDAANVFGSCDFSSTATSCRHVFHVFVPDLAQGNLTPDFGNDEAVRPHLATHHSRSQTPGSLNGDYGAVTRERATREHHSGAARIHHALDNNGHRHLVFRYAALSSISDRGDRVDAGPTGAYGMQGRFCPR